MCGCVSCEIGARLTVEAFAELPIGRERRRKDLNGDRAIQPRVSGFVHLAHTACPQGRDDLVRAEARAGVEGQGFAMDYMCASRLQEIGRA